MAKKHDPNLTKLWGLKWRDAGTFWQAEGINLWQEGGVWIAKAKWGDTYQQATGTTQMEALRALLGDPLKLAADLYYPCSPPGAPTRRWVGVPGVLIQAPEGWRWEPASEWYPSPKAALQAILKWNGWGPGWFASKPLGSGWNLGASSITVKRLPDGTWRCTDGESVDGPTPEAACRARLGEPVVALGLTYYPQGENQRAARYRAVAPLAIQTVHKVPSGWQVMGEGQFPEPDLEICLRKCLRSLAMRAERSLERAHKQMAEARKVAKVLGL